VCAAWNSTLHPALIQALSLRSPFRPSDPVFPAHCLPPPSHFPLLSTPLLPAQTAFRGTAVGDKVPVTFSNPSVNVDDTRNPNPATPQVAPAVVNPVVAPQAPPVVQKDLQVVEGDKVPVTFSNPSVAGPRTPTPVVAPVMNQQQDDQEGGAVDKAPVTFNNPSVSVDEAKKGQQVDGEDESKEQFSG